MRRNILGMIVATISLVVAFKGQAVYASCDASAIVIDGQYDDWADCPSLVTDKKGDLNHLQYWDNSTRTWSTTNPGSATWTFDDGAMMDVVDFKMLNDDKYMYLDMASNWPMMVLKAPDGMYYSMGELSSPNAQSELEKKYDFVPSSMPDFDHWMVWSYDTNLDNVYDYFFGAHLSSSLMASNSAGQGPGLVVYKDNGDGVFNADTDTKLTEIDTASGKTSMDNGQNSDSLQFEVQQDISQFYQATGINFGDTVKIRMETHSTFGDKTKGKKYTFSLGKTTGLKASVTSSQVTLSWDKNKAADFYQVVVYSKDKAKLAVYKVTDTSTMLTDLAGNTNYRFRVRAKLTSGAKGAFSNYKSFTTQS